jgi:hypothetical protein
VRGGWFVAGAVAIAGIAAGSVFLRVDASWPSQDAGRNGSGAPGGDSGFATEGDGSASDEDDPVREEARARRIAEELHPLHEGQIRFKAAFRVVGGAMLSYRFVEARPADGTPSQKIEPKDRGTGFVVADSRCPSIDFSSRGFADVHHDVTADERERQDLGTIVFAATARLEIEIRHAPMRSDRWLSFQCFTNGEVPQGRSYSIQFASRDLATPDRTASFSQEAPSDSETSLSLQGPGVRLRRRIPAPPAGATTVVFDFDEFARFRGRVVNVPPVALPHLHVVVDRVLPERDGFFPSDDVEAPLDGSGSFSFAAFDTGPFQLRLDGCGTAALREPTGAQSMGWRSSELTPERELVVEPAEEMVGVRVGPIDADGTMATSFTVSLSTGSPQLHYAGTSGDGVVLVSAAALRSARAVCVELRSNWTAVVDPARISAPRDGIVTIPVLDPGLPTATLIVSHDWFAPRDVDLAVVPTGAQPHEVPSPSRRERGLFSFTFTRLPPASYDVWQCGWGCQRKLAGRIDVGPGETKTVDVTIPKWSRRRGRIASWNDIPVVLRPHGIGIDGQSATIVDGRFEIAVASPVPAVAKLDLPRQWQHSANAAIEVLEDGTLEVRFPTNDYELFEVATRPFPDRRALLSTLPADIPDATFDPVFDRWPRSFADESGTIRVLRTRGAAVRGFVRDAMRANGSDRRILAWISSDVPCGTIVPAGRYVEVSNRSESAIATLEIVPRPVGEWQPPIVPICKVTSLLPRRVWLPDGAAALRVRFHGDVDQTIAVETIGATLAVSKQ